MKDDLETISIFEQQLNALVHPFLNRPEKMALLEDEAERTLQAQLWNTLMSSLDIILTIHNSLETQPPNSPSKPLTVRTALLTGYLTGGVEKKLDAVSEPFDPERFGVTLFRQMAEAVRDKLAGLYFVSGQWKASINREPVPGLGQLTGAEWLRLLTLYIKQKEPKINS